MTLLLYYDCKVAFVATMSPVAPSLSGSSKNLPTFMSNLVSNPPLFVAALVFVMIIIINYIIYIAGYQTRIDF